MISIPNFPEREIEFLGLVLQSPVSVNEFAQRVPAAAFTNELTRACWQAMLDLSRVGTVVSIPAIRERVKFSPDKFGIPSLPAFLSTCQHKAGQDISLDDLADIIVDEAHKRSVSDALMEIQKELNEGRSTGEEIALRATQKLQDAVSEQRAGDTISLYEASTRFVSGVNDAFNKGEPVGSDWGLRELDRIMGTIQNGDFGVLGGPSGQGKSALAMQIGMHIAKRFPVLMIQAEMRHEDVAGREVLGMSGVSSAAVETGQLQAAELEAIVVAANRLQKIPMEITYTGDMRVSRINNRIQSFKYRHGGCGLVIIDTIKHVDCEDKRATSLVERIMSSAKKLDYAAKKFNVPIMALAQVKRSYMDRSGEGFSEHDLYGGGDLIEAASWCLLMHQPSIRAELNGGRDAEQIIDKWEGKAQVITGKRRRGKKLKGVLNWVPERTRFADPGDDVTETFL